eukprot:8698203-Alexandrium_andersonii.AAC.1
MSASLVGSEMCIRDSSVGVRLSEECRRLWCNSARLRSRPRRVAHSHAPVSYTHLTLPTICSV